MVLLEYNQQGFGTILQKMYGLDFLWGESDLAEK